MNDPTSEFVTDGKARKLRLHDSVNGVIRKIHRNGYIVS